MNKHAELSLPERASHSSGCVPIGGTAGSDDNPNFNLSRTAILFPTQLFCFTTLPWRSRGTRSPRPCQHLLFLAFFFFCFDGSHPGVKGYLSEVLICFP